MDVKQVYNDLVSMNIGKVIENEPMYKHTTYKVGGPAKIFVKANDIDSLIQTLNYCRDHDIKHMVIGNGSDLLFSDKEYDENSFEKNKEEKSVVCEFQKEEKENKKNEEKNIS